MKQYIGFVRDHSLSMSSLREGAVKDYNSNVNAVKKAANDHGIDTIVSTVLCGWQDSDGDYYINYSKSLIKTEVVNSSVNALKPLSYAEYVTKGRHTPLFDSVMAVVDLLEAVPDATDKDVSFLIIVVTDGEENSSVTTARKLGDRLKKLQATDRWTFTFRVPRGYARDLVRLGIPAGNILEWDQTQESLEYSSGQTQAAVSNYYVARTRGVTGTSSFYADLRNVTATQLRKVMKDITNEAQVWDVSKYSNTCEIRTYVEGKLGSYLRGAAFYELTKPEKVQPNKMLVVIDKISGKVYGGYDARYLLGLPDQGDIRLRPGDHGNFDVFVQSNSVNRKLVGSTRLIYWPGAVLNR